MSKRNDYSSMTLDELFNTCFTTSDKIVRRDVFNALIHFKAKNPRETAKIKACLNFLRCHYPQDIGGI